MTGSRVLLVRPARLGRLGLLLAGAAGVLCNLLVVQTAISGVQRVQEDGRAATRTEVARSALQDVSAVHDDVYSAVLVGLLAPEGLLRAATRPLDAVVLGAARSRADLSTAGSVALPAGVERDLARIRPRQEGYLAEAARLLDPGRSLAVRRADLPAFQARFQGLLADQDQVIRSLASHLARTRDRAEQEQRRVERLVILASVGTLIGLLALSFGLVRLFRTLALVATEQRGVAETLQRMMLPEALPTLPGVRMSAAYLAGADGNLVGGDWYDVLALPTGAIALVMGDVAGHDLQAASEMSQLRNGLRAFAAEGGPPEQVLERLNQLCFQNGLMTLATCVYAVLEPVSATLTVVNAGHCPPLLVESPNSVRYLEAVPRPPVGAMRNPRYAPVRYALPPGGLLLLYTDGLIERRGERMEEGMDRLMGVVRAAAKDPDLQSRQVLDAMIRGGQPQDDVALLTVRLLDRLGDHLSLTYSASPTSLRSLRATLQRWLDEAGASDTEVYEITVACSEAATNAIEHAYGPAPASFSLDCGIVGRTVRLQVRDWGAWRAPRGQDRGRGLRLMHDLMDEVEVVHGDQGTHVDMRRLLADRPAVDVMEGPA